MAKKIFTGRRVGRKDAPDIKASIAEALKERDAKLQQLVDKAQADIEATGRIAEETKSALTKLSEDGIKLQERLLVLEQLAVNPRGSGAAKEKSAGEAFCESAQFKSMAENGRGTATMRVKAVNAITSATAGTGAAGGAIPPDRLPGIVTPAQRVLTIRDLIMPGRTSSNLVQYVQETGFQNNADPVAEGALKPQSDITFDLKDSSVKTIAHWVKASVQILADVPQLQSYIDIRMTYGLKYVEEMQLLAGDGTGQNLLGLIPQATPFNDALRKANDTKIDTIRRAVLQVRNAEYRASAIVLNPNDWADIELGKDANGRYLWVNVGTGAEPQLWRLPVVETTAMPSGYFMVGAFNIAAQLFDREDANVQVSTEDGDNFVKNMVTIRVEERLALCVYRPESFVYGPFVKAP